VTKRHHVIGVDPGQAVDRTAIAVVRVVPPVFDGDAVADHLAMTPEERPTRRRSELELVHLERLPLHTLYPDIARRVRGLLQHPDLAGAELVLDLTGVGRPTNDIFRDAGLWPIGVTITAGHEETEVQHGRYYHVPKLTLVSRVQSLLHERRLLIHKDLPDTPALIGELQDFRAQVSDSGRWTFGARAGAHDDLVLALALACWRASRPPPIASLITPEILRRARFPGPHTRPRVSLRFRSGGSS
jgi:hypothetical protein